MADKTVTPTKTEAPTNQRLLVFGTMPDGTREMAMAWKDRIDLKWYYAPQGGLVPFEVERWCVVPEPQDADDLPMRLAPDSANDTVCAESYLRGLRNGLTQAAKLLTVSPSTIRLHAGEMTAQEMRSVRAVLGWKIREIERLADV